MDYQAARARCRSSTFLVEGFVESVVSIVGKPGSFKKFLALDLRRTAPVNGALSVYVSTEGDSEAFLDRVDAWTQAAARKLNTGMHFWFGPVRLLERGSVSSSLDEVRHTTPEGVTMVVLDAFAWCAAGGDENAPRDMGIAIDALDQIKRGLSATVCS